MTQLRPTDSFEFGPSRTTHGPNFDALAQQMVSAKGDVIPRTAGDLARGQAIGGKVLSNFAVAVQNIAMHKGLELDRDRTRD